MSDFNEIDDLFADEFGGEQITPPSSVKKEIDKELFGKKKGGIIWLWPVALLLLIGGVVSIFFLSDSNEIKPEQNKVAQASVNEDERHTEVTPNDNLSEDQTSAYGKKPVDASDRIETNLESSKNEEGTPHVFLSAEGQKESVDSSESPAALTVHVFTEENREDSEGKEREENKEIETDVNKKRQSKHNGPQHETENRGMNITSNLSVADAQTIEQPSKPLIEKAYAPKEEDNRNRSMDLTLYAGLNRGGGNVNYSAQTLVAQDIRVSEATSLNIGAEWGLHFNNGVGVSTGFEYNMVNSEVIETTVYPDSVIIDEYWEYTYNDPVTQDSIIDSTYIYVKIDYEGTEASMVTTTAISIPLYFTYKTSLGANTDISVATGFRFNYLKQVFTDENPGVLNPDLKQFSISLMIRPEITHYFNRFGVGLYGRFGYDFRPGMEWSTLRRNRIEGGGGILLRYRL